VTEECDFSDYQMKKVRIPEDMLIPKNVKEQPGQYPSRSIGRGIMQVTEDD
jgi:hypothetical protein